MIICLILFSAYNYVLMLFKMIFVCARNLPVLFLISFRLFGTPSIGGASRVAHRILFLAKVKLFTP